MKRLIKLRTFTILFVLILIACNSRTSINDSNEFDDFYNKFIKDSIFQMERIKFPIEGQYEDYNTQKDWSAENWPMITWNFKEDMNTPIDSISVISKENEYFVGTYCLECGFSFEMQFERINNKWYLTYRQENNY